MSGYDQPYTLVGDVAESWNASSSNSVTNADGSTSTTVGSTTTTTPPSTMGDVLVGSLISGFKWIGNLFFTKGIILAALLFFVDFFITLFLELIGGILDIKKLTGMISQFPFTDFLKYLLYLGAIDYGLPLILSAYLLKFFIRRLPVVG